LSNKKKSDAPGKAAKYLRAWPDLAERWGISRATAYRYAGTVLPVMEVGQNRLVPLEAIEQYERDHTRLDSERRP
jgi:predicted site-specific integrase-resolvase